MTCSNQGIIGAVVDRSTPDIVQDADAFLVVQIVFKGSSDPYSFQNFLGATGHFSGEAALISIPASLESADLGKLRVDLAASATAELALGESLAFQVDFEDDRGLSKILIDEAISVVAPIYPP